MKRFVFDALVDKENICNQKNAIEKISRFIDDGRKVVLFGRRNRAKTSIVKNIIMPLWHKSRKNSLTIYTEFMHVKSLDDINERFTKSFSSELQKKAKIRSFLQSAVEILKGLSPTYTLADDGKMEFALSVRGRKIIAIDMLLDKIAELHKSGKPCLLCFDEFQDIAKVPGAEALLRRKFEEMPLDMPIICLGSKRHLLLEVFHKKDAPFADWGATVEIDEIPHKEYANYLRERLTGQLKLCSDDVLIYLQDRLLRSPEAIQRICFEANSRFSDQDFTTELADQLIIEYVSSRSSYYESKLERLSAGQVDFLKKLAKTASFQANNVYTKDTLESLHLTAAGLRKAIQKLMDYGDIECLAPARYAGTDPLLMHYVRLTRVT